MKIFEDKFMDIQIGMVSLANEYVQGQAEKIYIYGIADSLYSFNVFYRINGKYVRKHRVNAVFPEDKQIDVSDSAQSSLLNFGLDDIQSMIALCKEYGKEHPTEMWLIYDAQKNSLETKYNYDGRFAHDEDILLSPNSEFDKWMEEVKANNL